MTRQRISELVPFLPQGELWLYDFEYADPDSVCYTTPAERAHGRYLAPDFAWRFVQTFVRAQLPLPSIVDEPYLHRAYRHLKGEAADPVLAIASELVYEFPGYTQLALQAALLLPTLSFHDIAAMLGVECSFVELYHDLFFACRPYLDDTMYVSFAQVRPYVESRNMPGPRGHLIRTLIREVRARSAALRAKQDSL